MSASHEALLKVETMDDAYEVIQALSDRFGLAIVAFAPEDCMVHKGDDVFSLGEAGPEDGLEGVREAIAEDRQWYRWLPEALTERGSQMLPTVYVENGSGYEISW